MKKEALIKKNREEIGMKLKLRRTELNLSLAELSEASGIPASTISQIENGKKNATIDLVGILSKTMGLSLLPVREIPVFTPEQFAQFTAQMRKEGKDKSIFND